MKIVVNSLHHFVNNILTLKLLPFQLELHQLQKIDHGNVQEDEVKKIFNYLLFDISSIKFK